jgi:hypothetical protein
VEARGHTPVRLAVNDRVLVATGAPPLVTRAAAAVVVAKPAPKPTGTAPTVKPSLRPATQPAGTASATPDQPPELKDKIRTSVRAVLGDLKGCYETVLGKDADVAGRLVVQMRIVARDGKGRVDDAEVVPQENGGGDLRSPLFEQCVLEVLAKADFPRPNGDQPMIVTYPFAFANER